MLSKNKNVSKSLEEKDFNACVFHGSRAATDFKHDRVWISTIPGIPVDLPELAQCERAKQRRKSDH